MKCSRCGKSLKKAYRYNGSIYGPECIKKVGGSVIRSTLIQVKDGKDKELQIELFI